MIVHLLWCKYSHKIPLSLSLCVCEECLWLRYHCQSFGVILWKLLGTLRMFFFLFIEWLIIINLTVPQVVQSFDVTNLQSELSRLRGLYTTCCMGAIGGPPHPPKGHFVHETEGLWPIAFEDLSLVTSHQKEKAWGPKENSTWIVTW